MAQVLVTVQTQWKNSQALNSYEFLQSFVKKNEESDASTDAIS
jgi:predicted neutral ceramidase superfamily lipid hydrolase